MSRPGIGPRSFLGQTMLALALALLLAQAISTVLLYRVGMAQMHERLVHSAAFRVLMATRQADGVAPGLSDEPPPVNGPEARPIRAEQAASFQPAARDVRWPDAEAELHRILAEQDVSPARLLFVERPVADDPVAQARVRAHANLMARTHVDRAEGHPPHAEPDHVLLVAVQRQAGGPWLIVRVLEPGHESGWRVLGPLLVQTVLIYLVLVGAMALILRHITRPLAALTRQVERFARSRSPAPPLAPQGPDDLRRLIEAHNALEARVSALLDEKDVMLGAIGHDLKTPLAALRVRVESVEDATERERMAATIEDIARSLDDILSLARVGRPSDPLEVTELSALVAAVVEEFEDMGEAVELGVAPRLVLPLRATWLRRALRNLVSNALRYGRRARVSLARESVGGSVGGSGPAWAAIRVEDDGPGIPEADIARMLEPFTRGDPSRSSATGGAGLGLTLARAIAEQHGGSLSLTNRLSPDGGVAGLVAVLRLPLA